jgi:membrane associated rhomboid family serine protease
VSQAGETSQKHPVISGTALLAIGVTVAWWTGTSISPLLDSAEIRRGQIWRLATSTFPHVNFLHLAFNVYWLWVFGTAVERAFGHLRTVLLMLFLAVASSTWDFALTDGGLGLSGVGYGLVGLLYVLSQYDERFRGSIDKSTVNLFIGWFFFGVFATATHMFNVANGAHGTGALFGALLK